MNKKTKLWMIVPQRMRLPSILCSTNVCSLAKSRDKDLNYEWMKNRSSLSDYKFSDNLTDKKWIRL
ncbi:MAG: hypothetical protein ACLU1V_14510 [Bacteroides fragilis]